MIETPSPAPETAAPALTAPGLADAAFSGLAGAQALELEPGSEAVHEPQPAASGLQPPLGGGSAILSIPISLELVLTTVRMPVSRLMDLVPGAEIDLDRMTSGEVQLLANGAPFATGELFLIDPAEKRVGLRIKRLGSAGMPIVR
jgi:flagellar motor switch/type III secretory pathway protein FliN